MNHMIKLAVLTALASSAALAVGCSSDSNDKNPAPIGGDGGGSNGGQGGSATGGKGGSSGSGTGGMAGGATGGTAGGGNTGGSSGTGGGGDLDGGSGGQGGGGTIEAGVCVLGTQDPPCYTCQHGTPSTDDEFLNQCTANSCVKFDNSGLPNPLPQLP